MSAWDQIAFENAWDVPCLAMTVSKRIRDIGERVSLMQRCVLTHAGKHLRLRRTIWLSAELVVAQILFGLPRYWYVSLLVPVP